MTRIKFASLRRKPEVERPIPSPPPAYAGGSLATFAKILFSAFVLTSLLFAHGCHGNEDNELFTALKHWVKR